MQSQHTKKPAHTLRCLSRRRLEENILDLETVVGDLRRELVEHFLASQDRTRLLRRAEDDLAVARAALRSASGAAA